jgi:hypothetical protein
MVGSTPTRFRQNQTGHADPGLTIRANGWRGRASRLKHSHSRYAENQDITPDRVTADYSVRPLQPGWPHMQSTSGVFSMAAHCVLQYLPLVVVQEQTGCAHFWPFAVSICFSPKFEAAVSKFYLRRRTNGPAPIVTLQANTINIYDSVSYVIPGAGRLRQSHDLPMLFIWRRSGLPLHEPVRRIESARATNEKGPTKGPMK